MCKYKIDIDGKGKHLTLVGEQHDYNETEHRIAQRLVDGHQHFASEIIRDFLKDLSMKNFFYGVVLATPYLLANNYAHLGNGRWYDSIREIAEERGYRIHALEKPDDPFNSLSAWEKVTLLGESFFSVLTAPWAYYEAKNEIPYNPHKFANYPYREHLIDRRDKIMAKGIVDLLKKDEIDKLLAGVGRAHLEGIIRNLSAQVRLQEVAE